MKSPNSSSTILESIISLKTKVQSEKPTKTSHTALESKNLDSSDSVFSPSLRAVGEAIHKQSLDFSAKMDYHEKSSDFSRNDRKLDSTAFARNDRKNSPCEKLDSSTNAPSLSSRADTIGVAIHNSAPAESNQINSAHKVRNLESALSIDLGGLGGGISACLSSGSFRSEADFTSASGEKSTRLAQTQCARKKADKGGELANSNPLSPLEKDLQQTKLESSESAQKVDSTFAKLDSNMDCHEVVPTSRNDSNSSALDCRADLQLPSGEKSTRLAQTQCARKKADSRDQAQNPKEQDSKTAKSHKPSPLESKCASPYSLHTRLQRVSL